MMKTSIYNHQT